MLRSFIVSRAARTLQASIAFVSAVLLGLLTSTAYAINWNYLDGPLGGQPTALFGDPDGNMWAGMNGGGVFYRAAGASAWEFKPGLPTQSNYRFAKAGNGTIYVSGSAGVFMRERNASTWIGVSGANGLPNEAGAGLASDAGGSIYAGMNNNGAVFKRTANNAPWTSVGTGLPANGVVDLLEFDAAGNLWAILYGIGAYKLPAGGTAWSVVNDGLSSKQIQAVRAVGNDLFIATTNAGAFKLANAAGGGTTWAPWNGGALGASDSLYGFAVGDDDTLFAVGYGEAFALETGSMVWRNVGAGLAHYGLGYAIVFSNFDRTLSIANGSGVVELPDGETNWQLSSAGMTSTTVYGIALAPSGDLYAATFGQGVARMASGTSTWARVDPANIATVVQAVAIDGQGNVFAAAAGTVKKLVNGQWVNAGTDLAAFPTSLVIDAQNNVWAGQPGRVQRLAAGASAWVTVGTGLPAQSANAIVFDSAGNVYAGLYDGGVYKLGAGSSTWVALNNGLTNLRVRSMARSLGNEIYAGTGAGVFKLAGNAWQPVGTGLVTDIYALAVDGGGDLYAGVDNDYAWRLVAGTTQWSQIPLGLAPRTVQSLTFAGERIYAGTDASRGSPSGVYVLSLSDTVVEFYNSILDHFFITASAAEQASVLSGFSGPGWTATGNVFSAGGPELVCRFYGSLSPGPNSHFYTIKPDECQGLKDIQAQTPDTEKRWNFESNDFASTRDTNGQCPANTIAVYRAYNNGFAHGIDSNHRITTNRTDYLIQVANGWIGEGVVMCAAR